MARRHRVVIVGAGFGGLSAAKALSGADIDVLVIDRRNHHLFQPLLYQVASAALSPADIAVPIRSILAGQKNVTVLLGKVTGVDTAAKSVQLADGPVPYDTLILGTGARHAYFGHPEWEADAPGLKTLGDATAIRHRLLAAFERAEATDDPAARRRLMTVAVIGGGPTGVEMAGAVAELAKTTLKGEFRKIDPRETRILLVEAGPRILTSFPEALSVKAAKQLARLGVEVHLGTPVSLCDEDGIVVGEERIPAATVIWGAGVQASPVGKWLGVETDRAGRVPVQGDFSVAGQPDIFVVGDVATLKDRDGTLLPGVAPAAKQAGAYVADVIKARLAGKSTPKPFRYRNYGNVATIGRGAAVADFGWAKFSGMIAWWLWGIVHIFFLIGFRNRIVVAINWLWSYLTFKRGARLITEDKTP
ncbi:NAD(P)/FAD-dependent oxidoreductase [Lacibacterium aquatile]|uniref:NADH:ubiquinone reductase (non-electrogenic) n=1 Tax=Lacibacterium aquatile TaxID=1168082 RepID=A0ABW5DYW1_9PROT